MHFDAEEVEGVLIVTPPKADLDAGIADEFKKDITPIVTGKDKVVVNMERISFIDSAGLGALISAYKSVIADGGKFAVYGLTEEVKALFDLVRIHRMFPVYEDKEAAVNSLK